MGEDFMAMAEIVFWPPDKVARVTLGYYCSQAIATRKIGIPFRWAGASRVIVSKHGHPPHMMIRTYAFVPIKSYAGRRVYRDGVLAEGSVMRIGTTEFVITNPIVIMSKS
jgi:hypothetical protein